MNASPLLNKVWVKNVAGCDTSFSLSLDTKRNVAIVAITQTGGIGSVFDADESGVECFMGIRGDGLEEAFCRSLLYQLRCHRLLLTMAVRSITSASLKELMGEIVSKDLV